MISTRTISISLSVLTIINVIIFVYKDHFQYQPYKTYGELYAPCDEACKEKWNQFVRDFPEAELAEAKRILDSSNISDSRFAFTKMMRIGNLIYNRFHTQLGMPSQELSVLSPLNQFKKLSTSKKEELWCGNYAVMFCYFCWAEGIVCRPIEIMNPKDHHEVAECYLPETKEWALVDLTSNFLIVKNNQNKILNLVSFKNALRSSVPVFAVRSRNDSFHLEQLEDTSYVMKVYYKESSPLYYYHQIKLDNVYALSGKIERYFFPVSWYDIYDDKQHSNFLFHVKEVFAFLWLLSFFLSIIGWLKFRS